MMASRRGSEMRRVSDRVRTEQREVRSSCSGWNVIRVSRGAFSRLARFCRCKRRRKRASSLLLVSRAVKIRVRDWDCGRISRNSSVRRQQVAKPRPLCRRSAMCTRCQWPPRQLRTHLHQSLGYIRGPQEQIPHHCLSSLLSSGQNSQFDQWC